MESGNSAAASAATAATAAAPVCTCENNSAGNVNFDHYYACPLIPKCPHFIMARNPQTGQMEPRPCGSRLEPQYAEHKNGCPLLPLFPNRRRSYSVEYDSSNNLYLYIFEPHFEPHIFRRPYRRSYEQPDHPNFQNILEIPVIPPAISASPPLIIDGDFEIEDECQCSVCLDECEQSQRVLKPAECDHCFHEKCLIPWISDHSTCPNCRRETQKILRKN
jgi:hypothetical protein